MRCKRNAASFSQISDSGSRSMLSGWTEGRVEFLSVRDCASPGQMSRIAVKVRKQSPCFPTFPGVGNQGSERETEYLLAGVTQLAECLLPKQADVFRATKSRRNSPEKRSAYVYRFRPISVRLRQLVYHFCPFTSVCVPLFCYLPERGLHSTHGTQSSSTPAGTYTTAWD